MNFHDPFADCIHNGDRYAVARLLVKLGVGIDGGGPVKHIIRKSLQSPALTGRQLANASAAERKCGAVFSFALICLLCPLYGQSVFAGIAIGRIKVYNKSEQQVKTVHIDDTQHAKERYAEAVEKAVEQLQMLYDKALKEVGEANAAIF